MDNSYYRLKFTHTASEFACQATSQPNVVVQLFKNWWFTAAIISPSETIPYTVK